MELAQSILGIDLARLSRLCLAKTHEPAAKEHSVSSGAQSHRSDLIGTHFCIRFGFLLSTHIELPTWLLGLLSHINRRSHALVAFLKTSSIETQLDEVERWIVHTAQDSGEPIKGHGDEQGPSVHQAIKAVSHPCFGQSCGL